MSGKEYGPIQGVIWILRWCWDQNDLVRVLISLTNTSKCLDLLERFLGTMIGIDRLNGGRHSCCRVTDKRDRGSIEMSPMGLGLVSCQGEYRKINDLIFIQCQGGSRSR